MQHVYNITTVLANESMLTYQWFAVQRYIMSTKPVSENITKITNVVRTAVWTYDICAFDTTMYYDYY